MTRNRPAREQKPNTPSKFMPFWYLAFMLGLLLLWQAAGGQYAVRTIPYSEFKQALQNGEVTECLVKPDTVEGKIQPKRAAAETTPSETAKPEEKTPAPGKPYLFRSIRVEDPKLSEELQSAGVKYTGARPSALTQLLLWWILPIGLMFLIWSFIGRRLGRAGESILSFGKSKGRLVVGKGKAG